MLVNSFNQNPYNNKQQPQPAFGLNLDTYKKAKTVADLRASILPEKADKYKSMSQRLKDGIWIREQIKADPDKKMTFKEGIQIWKEANEAVANFLKWKKGNKTTIIKGE